MPRGSATAPSGKSFGLTVGSEGSRPLTHRFLSNATLVKCGACNPDGALATYINMTLLCLFWARLVLPGTKSYDSDVLIERALAPLLPGQQYQTGTLAVLHM